jgi:membrane protease subunit (stomatin/prohibitin family)
MNGIAWGENGTNFTKSIQNSFRPLISTAVKSHLSNAIKSNNINVLEIDEKLETLSEIMRNCIIGGFEEYGLTIPQFYVSNVALPENDPNFRRLRELHTVSFQTRMIQAEALVKSAHADAEATVVAAERKAALEREATATELARREAERDVIRAQAEAQAVKMAGIAEAEVMAAKGYTERDVLAADVQKAYAEGIGNMTINGGGGGVAGDMIGLGVGMAAAGAVAPTLGEMFKGFGSPAAPATPTQAEPEAKCVKCGATLPANAKFCLECGEKVAPAIPADMIVCPECGNTVAKGKFCPECGHKFITVCPKCGKEIPCGAKFCAECGEKL